MSVLYTDPDTNEQREICGWPLKNGNGICKRTPTTSGFCRTHAKSLDAYDRDMAPMRVSGNQRYGHVLPKALLDFDALVDNDDDFYGMSPEIRIVDGRVRQLLTSLPEDTLADKLDQILDKLDLLSVLLSESDQTMLAVMGKTTFDEIHSLVNSVQNDRLVWQDISNMIEQRRKLVESERKRALEAQSIITQKQATLILQLILDVINRHVTDRAVKNDIAAELGKLADNKVINRSII